MFPNVSILETNGNNTEKQLCENDKEKQNHYSNKIKKSHNIFSHHNKKMRRNEQKCVETSNNKNILRRNEQKCVETSNTFECNICDYHTIRKSNLDRHLRGKKHLKMLELNNYDDIETKKQFYCEICNYKSKRVYEFERHINSKKHKINSQQQNSQSNKNIIIDKSEEVTTIKNYICSKCGKEYKSRSGLYKHVKSCNHDSSIDISNIDDINELKKLVLELTKSNEVIKELVKEPRIISNNNKTINIENYLNIECKDAINMSDFINQLQITLNDILFLGDNGFTKSIQNLFLSSLQDMEQTKRPIHCTNKKNKTLYIKDDNVWEKNDKENI